MFKKSAGLIFTTIFSSSIIGREILAYTNTSLDKVALLNRAVQDEKSFEADEKNKSYKCFKQINK